MGISVKSTFDKNKVLTKLADNAQKALELSVISETAVLRNRLLSGMDKNGSAVASYAPYSDSYAKTRKKAGRPTNKVTWDFSGGFNKSITYKIIRQGYKIIAEIFPEGYAERLGHLTKLRPNHWGLTKAQIERIKKAVAQFLSK